MRPSGQFKDWRKQIAMLAREVIQPLQTPDRET
jgi:hypothetical protein